MASKPSPRTTPQSRSENVCVPWKSLTVYLFRHLDPHLHNPKLVQLRLEVAHKLVEDIDAVWPRKRMIEELE